MLTRRALVLSGLFATIASAHAEPPQGNDPVAIVTAIYTRAAKGKGLVTTHVAATDSLFVLMNDMNGGDRPLAQFETADMTEENVRDAFKK